MTREILFFVSWFCDVSARCINLWSLFVLHCSMYIEKLCAYFEFRRETHVPIPNTLVKPSAVDGSATTLLCESRLLPG